MKYTSIHIGARCIALALIMALGACRTSEADAERIYEKSVLRRLAQVKKFEGYYVGDNPVKTNGGILFSKVAASTSLSSSDMIDELKAEPSEAGVLYMLIILYYKDRGAFDRWKHVASKIKIRYSVYDQPTELDANRFEMFLKDGSMRRDMCWRSDCDL